MNNTGNITVNDIQDQIRPLSKNGFARFFQRVWRGWLNGWYSFADKHPKLSKLIYMVVFFFIFSMAVTIWQFVIMTFMPYLFGDLNQVSFVWPAVEIPGWFGPDGAQLYYAIFNEPAAAVGGLGGVGNFVAFEIAVFTAQCINFPLQRNITFKSHGNIPWQIMWYFIGWVGISIFVNAVWGIVGPILSLWGLGNVIPWHITITGLVKTFITGGVSMIIFFFIFLIIFPDYNAVAKRAGKKVEKMKKGNPSLESLNKAEAKYSEAQEKATYSNAEKAEGKARSLASAKAMSYFAIVNGSTKANANSAIDYNARISNAFDLAAEAIVVKREAIIAFDNARAVRASLPSK